MIEAERKSAAFLQVGFLFRYRKLCRFVKQAIEDGKLGSLKMMWVQEFRGDWNPHGTKVESKDGNLKNWRYLNQQSGGSIVEKMCHDMDIFTWWADSRPRKVAASGGNAVYTDRETIDHTNIIIQYANDIELNLSLCLFAPNGRFTGRHIGLIGDGGTLDLPPKSTGCTIYRQNGEVEEYDNIDPSPRPGHHAGDASMLELDAFIDYIKSDEKPFASAEIGKMAVELSLAAEQAVKEQKVIEMD
jgi:predicted dehydrogenase